MFQHKCSQAPKSGCTNWSWQRQVATSAARRSAPTRTLHLYNHKCGQTLDTVHNTHTGTFKESIPQPINPACCPYWERRQDDTWVGQRLMSKHCPVESSSFRCSLVERDQGVDCAEPRPASVQGHAGRRSEGLQVRSRSEHFSDSQVVTGSVDLFKL